MAESNPVTNNVPAGDYYLICAGNTNLAMDVAGASKANGANVQLWTINHSEAQIFTLSYPEGSGARLLARWSGKSIDIEGISDNTQAITQGINLQINTNRATRDQRWTLEPTGNTVNYQGKSYATYFIRVQSAPTWVVEARGVGTPSSGTDLCVSCDETTSTDQHWLFVPVPPYRDGGLYEIRCYGDPSFCLDVQGGWNNNGANVFIHKRHGGNNQKFALEARGSYWAIRAIHSQKYIHIENADPQDGQNVHQWESAGEGGNPDQTKWIIENFGDMVIDGLTAPVVAIKSSMNPDLVFDVRNYNYANTNNVELHYHHGDHNQRFVLYPTTAEDPNMPAPHSLVWSTKPGPGLTGVSLPNMHKKLYPQWDCSKAWATPGENHYEYRLRKRYMTSSNSAWQSWSDWSKWQTADCVIKGTRAWLADGLDVDYDIAEYKNMQYELQVRTAGVSSLALVHGAAVDQVLKGPYRPNVTIGTAGWTPDGLRVPVTTDYKAGSTEVAIDSITFINTRNKPVSVKFKAKQTYSQLADEDSVLIPQNILTDVPLDNSDASMKFVIGTDQQAELGGFVTEGFTISYNAGSVALNGSVQEGTGRMVDVTLEDLGESKCWYILGGQLREAYKINDSLFRVPYPFDEDFGIVASSTSADEETWGVYHVLARGRGRSCHAFSWPGGYALVELREDELLETDYTLTPVYDAQVLNQRAREIVTYQGTSKGEFSVEGVLVPGVTESTREDILQLEKQRHVLYRSPNGWVAEVAVKQIKLVENHDMTDVSIELIEETI